MNLKFNVDYRTWFGEEIVLNIVGEHISTKYRMMTTNGKRWSCELNLADAPQKLVYFYDVERENHSERHEWTTIMHTLELNAVKGSRYTIYDQWHDIPEDSYLYSSAFTDCIRSKKTYATAPSSFARTVRFIVRAPQLNSGSLVVVGESEVLGAWNAT